MSLSLNRKTDYLNEYGLNLIQNLINKVPAGLESYLKEDYYCNFNHPSIKKLAEQVAGQYDTNKEKAVALFYWVRDNILYRVSYWQRTASDTLAEREGTCTNKANLLAALLRSQNIPAGYGVMKVYGQEYLGPICIPMVRKYINNVSTHVYLGVYLENRWVKVDPSDDYEFSMNTSFFNPPSLLVDWDGEKDAKLNLPKEHILSDIFPLSNIVFLMGKNVHFPKILVKVSNEVIKFTRNNKVEFSLDANVPVELQKIFFNYLRKKKIIFYISVVFFEFINSNFYLFRIFTSKKKVKK